ncbi:2364_t:CDS:2 [Gigaspora rosea]|nr:2364_t:CDS:2 [Gigaspora rosea]
MTNHVSIPREIIVMTKITKRDLPSITLSDIEYYNYYHQYFTCESLESMKYKQNRYFSDQSTTFHNALRLIDQELKNQEGYVNGHIFKAAWRRASSVSLKEINIPVQNSSNQELVLSEDVAFDSQSSTSDNVDLVSTSNLSEQSSSVTPIQNQNNLIFSDQEPVKNNIPVTVHSMSPLNEIPIQLQQKNTNSVWQNNINSLNNVWQSVHESYVNVLHNTLLEKLNRVNKEENNKLQKDLSNTEKKLAITEKELKSTNKKLAVTEKELESTIKKLSVTEKELESINKKLVITKKTILEGSESALNNKIKSLEAEKGGNENEIKCFDEVEKRLKKINDDRKKEIKQKDNRIAELEQEYLELMKQRKYCNRNS